MMRSQVEKQVFLKTKKTLCILMLFTTLYQHTAYGSDLKLVFLFSVFRIVLDDAQDKLVVTLSRIVSSMFLARSGKSAILFCECYYCL